MRGRVELVKSRVLDDGVSSYPSHLVERAISTAPSRVVLLTAMVNEVVLEGNTYLTRPNESIFFRIWKQVNAERF